MTQNWTIKTNCRQTFWRLRGNGTWVIKVKDNKLTKLKALKHAADIHEFIICWNMSANA